MANITVIGGSGYAGSHVIEAAAVRGHTVTSMTRREAAEQMAGVRYLTGSILSAPDRARALDGADVVVSAVSPRGEMSGRLRPAIAELAADASRAGVRLGVIGGAGSLLQEEGGDARVMDGPGFPDEIKPEAEEMGGVLEDLRAAPEGLDWFYVSPAGGFGPWAAGEYRGDYRVGGDVLLVDDQGRSDISGADLGMAVLDEVEDPRHRRARFTVAY